MTTKDLQAMNVRLTKELYRQLSVMAAWQNISRAELVRRSVYSWCNERDQQGQLIPEDK
jgi:predicted HicB family RNase H-like nuclease